MGDRFLINQSASNLIIYSYASSGLIGIILLSIVCLKIFIDFKFNFTKKKILEYSLYACIMFNYYFSFVKINY